MEDMERSEGEMEDQEGKTKRLELEIGFNNCKIV